MSAKNGRLVFGKFLETKIINVCDLIFDSEYYPRTDIDQYNISQLRQKIQAGITLDPIIVEKSTMKVVDGEHRRQAKIKEGISTIAVQFYRYKNKTEALAHSAILNLSHGKPLDNYDLSNVIQKLITHGLKRQAIVQMLGLTETTYERLSVRWARTWEAVKAESEERITLKATSVHLAGKTISQKQVDAIKRCAGKSQIWLIQQVKNLLEGDLVDRKNKKVMAALKDLKKLINRLV
jgi:hypothetical protein